MQPQLAFSRFFYWMDLWPEVVGAQKVVGDLQTAAGISL
jgi:hypothetical protein